MTRREMLSLAAAASVAGITRLRAASAPATTVSIAKCASYDGDLAAVLSTMFDQTGGLGRIVKNKTVTIKLNLTGSPGLRFQGLPLGSTHYTHPKTLMPVVHLLDAAGAKRIRLVESCWGTPGPLEEYMLDSGWNVRALQRVSSKLEFENTNAIGQGKRYSRLKNRNGGIIYPGFDVNHSYEDTDVFMSMAKLKNHATCGVTLSMKNCFGITPASIYGDDAGIDGPNENPAKGRGEVCHAGKRGPSKTAPQENDPQSNRDPGYRMPRIVADLAAARPIDIAFIDGIETMAGGEGPWVKDITAVKPGVLILGTNAVNADTVATAVMGYNPRAARGTAPFTMCDNTLTLAESLGVGTSDLSRIEVAGVPIAKAMYKFPS
ncbi:MAG: DUF362 domain-containing protein [Bryobacteraceae bacterium]